MNELMKKENSNTITSLELVEQINLFREKEGNRATLQHKTLLEIIRDEFSEEIGEQKILPSSYKSSQNKEQPMFELTFSQAKQVLVRESKAVRKAIIKYIEELEKRLQTINMPYKLPQNYTEALQELLNQLKKVQDLEIKSKTQEETIEKLEPLKKYYDKLSTIEGIYTTGQIAKNYGISTPKLHKILSSLSILKKVDDKWTLYTKFQNKGYMKKSKWTEKGKLKIEEILNSLKLNELNKNL